MTPEDKKLITVITRLYAKTKADVVEWEPSEDANLFAVKFSDYTISIQHIQATPNPTEWFILTIANNDGVPIQEMDSTTAKNNGFADMSDLFYRARRHAVNLDQALDDILKELDDLS
jgi:Flp pilus assembly CpaE family ATPase